MDSGSVAWMLAASALVLFMTPGLAFFYGGLVRGKNAISTVMYSFVAIGVVSVVWVLWGYSLAFGEGGDFIGNFDFLGFKDVASESDEGIPPMLFAIFQMMFAIITPALITGAIAERFKFTTYLIFLVAWVTFVYAPIAHWVWASDGWLFELGALDFAGGTVVHINAGVAAVAAAWLVGKRRGVDRGVEPHNVPFVILGASILWFGWFGFNAGSGLAADGLAVSAFLVTNTAAATALVVWLILGHIHTGKMSAVGAATGAVAGLVAITPASGFVGPMGSIAIGLGAGVLTFYAVRIRHKFGFDDALEVMAVHGIGGIWGALATGIFAVGGIGLIDGDAKVLGYNAVAVLSTIAYSFVVTFVILKILDVIPGLGLRADDAAEDAGLDVSLHGERAYVGDGAD
ncbi:MAG TPA: ammonia channel protein [Dehalococcoidia bacterium]|nr:ammonium transporter [Chloroflexota bacterium]HAG54875.1 ammonia channel protein [Dehalococcoidia bacterium]